MMARSSWFAIIRSYHLRRIWARSFAVLARQAGEGAVRSLDGGAGLGGGERRHRADHLTVRRVHHVGAPPGLRVHPLAVYVALLAEERRVLEEDALHDLGSGSAHGAMSLRSADWSRDCGGRPAVSPMRRRAGKARSERPVQAAHWPTPGPRPTPNPPPVPQYMSVFLTVRKTRIGLLVTRRSSPRRPPGSLRGLNRNRRKRETRRRPQHLRGRESECPSGSARPHGP